MEGPPDVAASNSAYREIAPGYDRHMRSLARHQRAAIEALAPAPGETIIDVACGTGLTFATLVERVGPGGKVVGIDASEEMLALARERVAAAGWRNVELHLAPVQEAPLGDLRADAALFSFTHDVLQDAAAVANVLEHLRAGGRVAATGAKLAGGWSPIVNAVVRRVARPYMTTFDGLDRPWRELERQGVEMRVRSRMLGGAYVAWGVKPHAD